MATSSFVRQNKQKTTYKSFYSFQLPKKPSCYNSSSSWRSKHYGDQLLLHLGKVALFKEQLRGKGNTLWFIFIPLLIRNMCWDSARSTSHVQVLTCSIISREMLCTAHEAINGTQSTSHPPWNDSMAQSFKKKKPVQNAKFTKYL